MPSFYVQNFGCRAAQADGAAIEHQFRQRGVTSAANPANASVVILNTCTVTASADRDARAAIRQIRRGNPACQIVVTGCYAQRAPEEIASLPEVDQVVGNSHKHRLAEIALDNAAWRGPVSRSGQPPLVPTSALLAPAESSAQLFVSDIFAHTELLAAPLFDAANERTRPNLKVQDGCNNRCSFCVIPYVRGRSRSLLLPEVLAEINKLVEAGYREVVISGINLGRWARDLRENKNLRLPDLIGEILAKTSLEKLRISSVEPMDWSRELIELMAGSSRIAKHAHVPLQSGSDRILRLMNRKYRPWHYRDKIEQIHRSMPNAAIGADVMVGFPGETSEDFDQTRRMIEELPFTYLHVFTYSARPGTVAAGMNGQVPMHVARERNQILRDLSAEKNQAFTQSFLGRQMEAITLDRIHAKGVGEFTEALTDNFLKLHLRGRYHSNTWMTANIEGLEDGVLIGEPEGRRGSSFVEASGGQKHG